jgi:hypothetical protein
VLEVGRRERMGGRGHTGWLAGRQREELEVREERKIENGRQERGVKERKKKKQ